MIVLQSILAALKLAPAFLASIWNLLGIALEIFKWIRSEYERSERAKITKDLKEAIQESRVSLDNSKLMNILQKKKPEDGS